MKKKINEEKNRIIALFGINEQEEDMGKPTPELTLKDKFKLIKFNDKKGKEVSVDFDEIDNINDNIDLFKQLGNNEDTSLIKAVIASKGNKDDEYYIVGGSFPSAVLDVRLETGFTGDYDGDSEYDYFKIESKGDNDKHFTLVKVGPEDLKNTSSDMEKGEVETDVETKEPVQQQPEQPFEEEMKHKEKKGLATLLDGGEPEENTFTKRQKKVLDKLKGEGYLLNRPENVEGYTKKRVTSKEFTESFNVWEPKK